MSVNNLGDPRGGNCHLVAESQCAFGAVDKLQDLGRHDNLRVRSSTFLRATSAKLGTVLGAGCSSKEEKHRLRGSSSLKRSKKEI